MGTRTSPPCRAAQVKCIPRFLSFLCLGMLGLCAFSCTGPAVLARDGTASDGWIPRDARCYLPFILRPRKGRFLLRSPAAQATCLATSERNGSGGHSIYDGARPDAVPSVSEKVGGTGLRTPPLAGPAFETKRPDRAIPGGANDDARIANYPAKSRYGERMGGRAEIRMRVPAVAEGLSALCVSLVSPVSRLIVAAHAHGRTR
ncbi:hypothetical protein PG996_012202 [Apiospora saccharicola]|uniref:Uncharacterized protein n=1 Tax=Apiospora saccharicola TaxID=335842 RepID=A0ABR1U1W9_9PEZI